MGGKSKKEARYARRCLLTSFCTSSVLLVTGKAPTSAWLFSVSDSSAIATHGEKQCSRTSSRFERGSLRCVSRLSSETDCTVHGVEYFDATEMKYWSNVHGVRRADFWGTMQNMTNGSCGSGRFPVCRCEYYRKLVSIPKGYVDSDATNAFGAGAVYDSSRLFPVHPFSWNLTGNVPKPIRCFRKLASGLLSVNSASFAHVSIEILPGLLFFLRHLPPDVPILFDMRGVGYEWSKLLEREGILTGNRLIPWEQNTSYFADELYFQLVESRNLRDEQLNVNSLELLRHETTCSWRPSLMNFLVRNSFRRDNTAVERRILVLHRRGTSARIVANHDRLIASLIEKFPTHDVAQFVGEDYTLEQAIRNFENVQIFIAPHGAGLIFMQFMQPGCAVVEIGYDKREPMPWPIDYYAGNALSLDLRYYLSVGEGSHQSTLIADIADILSITSQAVIESSDVLQQ